MLFGLKNAGAHFQREMGKVFRTLPDLLRHMDDFTQLGNTFKQWYLQFVGFHICSEDANLFLKLSKLQICEKQFKAYGLLTFEDGKIIPDKERMQHIKTLPVPKTKKDCQILMGLFVWFQSYIPNHATITEPIRKVIKSVKEKNGPIVWNETCQKALDKLKHIVLHEAHLHFPKFDEITELNPLQIDSDASAVAAGSTLYQIPGRKKRRLFGVSRELSIMLRSSIISQGKK